MALSYTFLAGKKGSWERERKRSRRGGKKREERKRGEGNGGRRRGKHQNALGMPRWYLFSEWKVELVRNHLVSCDSACSRYHLKSLFCDTTKDWNWETSYTWWWKLLSWRTGISQSEITAPECSNRMAEDASETALLFTFYNVHVYMLLSVI